MSAREFLSTFSTHTHWFYNICFLNDSNAAPSEPPTSVSEAINLFQSQDSEPRSSLIWNGLYCTSQVVLKQSINTSIYTVYSIEGSKSSMSINQPVVSYSHLIYYNGQVHTLHTPDHRQDVFIPKKSTKLAHCFQEQIQVRSKPFVDVNWWC